MSVRVALACAQPAEAGLRGALQHDPTIAVAAGRPAATPDAVDVLVVDLDSLGAAGLDVVRSVMRSNPVPVLALCPADGRHPTAADALGCGAVDAIGCQESLRTDGHLLRQRVQLVSGVSVVRRMGEPGRSPATPRPAQKCNVPDRARRSLVAIGASTGGPAALSTVLSGLSGLAAPVLVVQHLHADFMDGFVTWLAGLSALPVDPARHREPARPGHVYVAPAAHHLRLAADWTLSLDQHPVTVHRPAVDELFASVAGVCGPAGIGVLLTGMGHDGAAGLLEMRQAGAYTIAQDEATSAVFGMPAAAVALGAASGGVPVSDIADVIISAAHRRVR